MDILPDLVRTITDRRINPRADSYTTTLFTKGTGHIARKFGEESIELVVASMSDKKSDVIEEAADVMYHYLVLLAQSDVNLNEVCEVLKRRHGLSGLEEKANRVES